MTASIDTTGLVKMLDGVRRAVGGDLQRELVKNLHDAGPQMVTEMKGSAFTKIQRRAAKSIDVTREAKGISISGGGGEVLWAGAEYGGRKTKKVTYATRTPAGRAYIVRRRTTMQFAPHLGTHGYFYWPTVREWMDKLATQQDEMVNKVLGDG